MESQKLQLIFETTMKCIQKNKLPNENNDKTKTQLMA